MEPEQPENRSKKPVVKLKKNGGKTKNRMVWGDTGADVGIPSGEATGNRWSGVGRLGLGTKFCKCLHTSQKNPNQEKMSPPAPQATEQICLGQFQQRKLGHQMNTFLKTERFPQNDSKENAMKQLFGDLTTY